MRSDVEPIVVDDFYANPLGVREFALGALEGLVPPPGAPYAGIQSDAAVAPEALVQRFCELVGAPIRFDPTRDVFGAFRLSTARDRGLNHVHFDSTDWSAVVYLTPGNEGVDGTLFHRHRRTGRLGPELAVSDRGWSEHRDQLVAELIAPDTRKTDRWEIVRAVPYRFNRLVLFQGARYFHSMGASFGDDPGSGRLTQNFFFNL